MSLFKNLKLANALVLNAPNILFNAKKADKQTKIEAGKKLADSILKIDDVKVNVINKENLDGIDGCLILSNHQDNRDIWALYSIMPIDIRFVAKKELFNIPILSSFMKIGKSYSLDRQDAMASIRTLKTAIDDINKENANTVIFPEGTRSKGPLLNNFNSGIFSILKKCQKPIIPVYIDKSYDMSTKEIKVCIGKPISPEKTKELGTRKLLIYVEDAIMQLRKEYSNEHQYSLALVNNPDSDLLIDTLSKQQLLAKSAEISDGNYTDYDVVIINDITKDQLAKLKLNDNQLVIAINLEAENITSNNEKIIIINGQDDQEKLMQDVLEAFKNNITKLHFENN